MDISYLFRMIIPPIYFSAANEIYIREWQLSLNLNFIVTFYKKEKASKMLSLFFLRSSSCLEANWPNNSFVSNRKFFLMIISACHSESESWRHFPTNNCCCPWFVIGNSLWRTNKRYFALFTGNMMHNHCFQWSKRSWVGGRGSKKGVLLEMWKWWISFQ